MLGCGGTVALMRRQGAGSACRTTGSWPSTSPWATSANISMRRPTGCSTRSSTRHPRSCSSPSAWSQQGPRPHPWWRDGRWSGGASPSWSTSTRSGAGTTGRASPSRSPRVLGPSRFRYEMPRIVRNTRLISFAHRAVPRLSRLLALHERASRPVGVRRGDPARPDGVRHRQQRGLLRSAGRPAGRRGRRGPRVRDSAGVQPGASMTYSR